MLFMQWLIWGGIVLYVGKLFGYLVLYGCIWLLLGFVKLLFGIIWMGVIVVIICDVFVFVMVGVFVILFGFDIGVVFVWNFGLLLIGLVLIVISGCDKWVVVLCNGIQIGVSLIVFDMLVMCMMVFML